MAKLRTVSKRSQIVSPRKRRATMMEKRALSEACWRVEYKASKHGNWDTWATCPDSGAAMAWVRKLALAGFEVSASRIAQ